MLWNRYIGFDYVLTMIFQGCLVWLTLICLHKLLQETISPALLSHSCSIAFSFSLEPERLTMTLTITEYNPEQHDHSLTSSPSKPPQHHTQELSSPSHNNNNTDLINNNHSGDYQMPQQPVPTTPMIHTDPRYNIDYNSNSSFSPYKVSFDHLFTHHL